jgi:RimJ/RimL family protein N-acetyltransferase
MIVRRLEPGDAETFRALRLEGLVESPAAFGSSPDVASEHDLDLIRSRLAPKLDAATFGAFAGEQLVGVLGLHRPTHPKGRHRGQIWGMYVDPAHRGRGLGRALLAALIEYARGLDGLAWLDLGVGVDNAAARAVYDSLGFEAWGVERDALRVDGERVDEAHMTLELDG